MWCQYSPPPSKDGVKQPPQPIPISLLLYGCQPNDGVTPTPSQRTETMALGRSPPKKIPMKIRYFSPTPPKKILRTIYGKISERTQPYSKLLSPAPTQSVRGNVWVSVYCGTVATGQESHTYNNRRVVSQRSVRPQRQHGLECATTRVAPRCLLLRHYVVALLISLSYFYGQIKKRKSELPSLRNLRRKLY